MGKAPPPSLWGEGGKFLFLPFGGERSSPSFSRGREGAGAAALVVVTFHVWLTWPWASQVTARGRIQVPTVLATCVPCASKWAVGCAKGRRAFAHRRLVTFACFGEQTWHLQPCRKWSGNQTRAVGGWDHRTPSSEGIHSLNEWCKPGSKHTNTHVLASLGLP